jgi:outer membrane protein OmpA-like peptidoglycan-associated protein
MRLTPIGKIVALILVVGIAFGVWKLVSGGDLLAKLAPAAPISGSQEVARVNLPGMQSSPIVNGAATAYTEPGTSPGCTDKPEVRFLIWAWNAQMGALLANGGPQATSGSLMCRNGVNLKFARQDDTSKMQEALVAFASELKAGNTNPGKGAHFVAIMGDGAATFLKGLNDQLRKLGLEYTAKVVGSCGFSRGEDKFMGPPGWKSDPQSSRGGVVAGVLRDGDWNIAQKWLGDNGLRNNPNEKTWDPDALNWVAANDYIDAAEKYISGFSEERPVVRNGKPTGERKRITVEGVVTWTPGDVSVAKKKGGLASIASTLEYSSQMPNVIIGIDRWMKEHRDSVVGMLDAFTQGADQVKSNPKALHRAAEISSQVYHEENADYWERYYKGVDEQDKQGLSLRLGGSAVSNLADNLVTFGMYEKSANLFAATYRTFGDIVVAQYPQLVPSYPPVDQILDTSYLAALKEKSPTPIARAEPQPSFKKDQPVRTVISRKAWRIQFETGRAAFTGAATGDLERLKRDLLVAGAVAVEIHGHTDSVGKPDQNMALSEARAFAVKEWLEKQSRLNFPEGRIRVVAHGQQNPVAPNTTNEGRARNRRVEVVLGAQ